MLSFLEKVPQFWRRVSIVLTGAAAAQVIPFAVLPLLTRLLPPETLGKYFIWLGVASVTSVVATLRLDIAIFTAKSREELASLLQAAFISGVGMAGLMLLASLGVSYMAPGLVEQYMMKNGVIEAMCMAALLAITQTSSAAYVYSARFAKQALVKILMIGGVAVAQLIAVVLGFGLKGMIFGQLFATACIAAWLITDVRRSLSLDLGKMSIPRYLSTLRMYWRFPVFSMPADFISSISAQLPLFLIGAGFGTAPAGQYALTNRTLAAPVGLVAGSVLAVFKEEASRQYRDTGQCRQAYVKTFRTLALLGAVPFAFLFLSADDLFLFVFGPGWGQAGQIAKMLMPMFYLKFVASPLSYTMYLANRQLHDLSWQIALLAMTAYVFHFSGNLGRAVATYSAGYGILYLVYLLMSYQAAKGKGK